MTTGVTASQLRQIIERIERLEIEKSDIQDNIKQVLSEAKANGFDTKAIKEIIKLRKKDNEQRAEEEAVLETYMSALGMD